MGAGTDTKFPFRIDASTTHRIIEIAVLDCGVFHRDHCIRSLSLVGRTTPVPGGGRSPGRWSHHRTPAAVVRTRVVDEIIPSPSSNHHLIFFVAGRPYMMWGNHPLNTWRRRIHPNLDVSFGSGLVTFQVLPVR